MTDSHLIHPIVLGEGFIIPGNILLAPMAGFTDLPFRSLCIECGAFFTYTEMVSSQAVSRRNDKTLRLCEPAPNEISFGIQIFASDPEIARKSINALLVYRPALIDLNCGCSIPKILKSGSGAALLSDPIKIGSIISAMKAETDLPITCKIRSGPDAYTINFIEVARRAEDAGASLITLHPRTRSDVFRGKAEWGHLAALKKTSSVPVIGSGDLFSPDDVRRMLIETGCDGVMLARGTIGNPNLFRDTIAYLKNGMIPPPLSIGERLELALRHLGLMVAWKGEKKGCIEMRKHFCAYTKGLPDSGAIRRQVVTASTVEEYENIVQLYTKRENVLENPDHFT
jgi:tRNA-dihydrouridine synthase B